MILDRILPSEYTGRIFTCGTPGTNFRESMDVMKCYNNTNQHCMHLISTTSFSSDHLNFIGVAIMGPRGASISGMA